MTWDGARIELAKILLSNTDLGIRRRLVETYVLRKLGLKFKDRKSTCNIYVDQVALIFFILFLYRELESVLLADCRALEQDYGKASLETAFYAVIEETDEEKNAIQSKDKVEVYEADCSERWTLKVC